MLGQFSPIANWWDWHADILAECRSRIVFMIKTASLQFWDDVVHHVLIGPWYIAPRKDKSVAPVGWPTRRNI